MPVVKPGVLGIRLMSLGVVVALAGGACGDGNGTSAPQREMAAVRPRPKVALDDEAGIDQAIDGACLMKSEGLTPKPEDVEQMDRHFGSTLAEYGHDAAGFVRDAMEGNRNIAELVGC